jgi:hypothetical protein
MLRGIGLKFRGVEGLTFVGDGYGVEGEYTTMQRLVLMAYQQVATQRALVTMGYSTTIIGGTAKSVQLEAVHA